jgi:hypothetical protein
VNLDIRVYTAQCTMVMKKMSNKHAHNWINRTDEVCLNKFGTKMKIIKYNTAFDLVVEFQDEHKVQKKAYYGDFKRGLVKNPYDKVIFREGYIGEGYLTQINKKKTKEYTVWVNMMKRCYSKYDNRSNAYDDCVVSESWKNYSNFCLWYKNNSYSCSEDLELDKDIFYNNMKIYSDNTCILIPKKINRSFRRSKQDGLDLINNTWRARFQNKHIGMFSTKKDAKVAFLNKKNKVFQDLVEHYKNELPTELYNKLKNVKLVF